MRLSLFPFLLLFALVSCSENSASEGEPQDPLQQFFADQGTYPSSVTVDSIMYDLRINPYEAPDTVLPGQSLVVQYIITNRSSARYTLTVPRTPRILFTIRSSSGVLVVSDPDYQVNDPYTFTVDPGSDATLGTFRTPVDNKGVPLPPGQYTLRIRPDASGPPVLMRTFIVR